MKSNIYPDDVLVLWASRRIGRPVKWTATRSESLLLDTQARDQVVYGELALDGDGKILGLRAKAYQALGAYWWAAITAPLFFSLMLIPSVYDVQAVELSTQAVFTNTAPTSVYRGAGRPEAIYLIERLIDRAAQVSGIDRVEIRRRNLIKPSALPYHTPTHHNYDSGEFERVMDKCLDLAGVEGVRGPARRQPGGTASCAAARSPPISSSAACSTSAWSCVSIRAAWSRSSPERIRTGRGTRPRSRSWCRNGSAYLSMPSNTFRAIPRRCRSGAARSRRAAPWSAARRCAARPTPSSSAPRGWRARSWRRRLNDIEFKQGRFTVVGTDKAIAMTDVAKAFYAPAGPVLKFGLGLEASGSYTGAPGGPPNYPNGCQVCEVEVDPETGAVTIERFAAVDDLGMIINPMICEGQIHGGIAQGAGQALWENVAYDSSGQLLTGSFLDYGMPRAEDFPDFVSELVEIPAKTNPLGIKGIGESGTIGAPPTIVNAVLDALRPLGVEHIDMPVTPVRVWNAITQRNSRTTIERSCGKLKVIALFIATFDCPAATVYE